MSQSAEWTQYHIAVTQYYTVLHRSTTHSSIASTITAVAELCSTVAVCVVLRKRFVVISSSEDEPFRFHDCSCSATLRKHFRFLASLLVRNILKLQGALDGPSRRDACGAVGAGGRQPASELPCLLDPSQRS